MSQKGDGGTTELSLLRQMRRVSNYTTHGVAQSTAIPSTKSPLTHPKHGIFEEYAYRINELSEQSLNESKY